MASRIMQLLEQWFGEPTGTNRGAIYFQQGTEWHPGVLFSQGHKSEIVMVDLKGSCLACTPVESFLQLTIQILKCGFRCTRIDLAVDHVGMNLALHQQALASCKAGELCKIRSYADDSEFKANGTPQRYLLKLGKRNSTVCVRIYDKGLETKTLNPGEWERLEVEFKKERAHEVCMELINAGQQMPNALWRYVIGAFDLRVQNGRTELSRRPQVDWWGVYVGQAVPLTTNPIKKESSLLKYFGWFRSNVGPRLLQLSVIFGIKPEDLFVQLIEGLEPATTQVPATVEARVSWMESMPAVDLPHY